MILFLTLSWLSIYYEGEYCTEGWRSWNMWNPKNHIELKIGSQNMFLSFIGESNANDMRFFFNQGHIEFRREQRDIGYHIVLFAREDRHWIAYPLLHLVNTDRIKDDAWGPKAEGIRADVWGNFYMTYLFSRYRVTEQGDVHIFKIGKKFMKRNYIFLSRLRKDHEIYDITLKLSPKYDLNCEFAYNKDLKSKAYKIEVRNLRFKDFLNAFSFFRYDKDFRCNISNKFNALFDKEYGRTGIYHEIVYLFPNYAITGVFKGRYYKSYVKYGEIIDTPIFCRWNYYELYLEFIYDFNLKLAIDETIIDRDLWRHLICEWIMEKKLYRLKFQYKLRNMGVGDTLIVSEDTVKTIGQTHLFGAELRFNLLKNLWFYCRTGYAFGLYKKWWTGFFQIGYRPSWNTEIYFEYGDPWQTDANIVDDWDFAENPNCALVKRFKIFVKAWF